MVRRCVEPAVGILSVIGVVASGFEGGSVLSTTVKFGDLIEAMLLAVAVDGLL